MEKSKKINTKRLQAIVSDFCKLYNLNLISQESKIKKAEAEIDLILIIREELDKYEN